MADRRELLLIRLEEILREIMPDEVPASNVYRNGAPVSDTNLPAMMLLDGSERTVTAKLNARGGPATNLMALEPQIFALLKERIFNKATEYGPELTRYRNAIYKAVMYDTQLLALASANGGIVYDGCETDMQSGSTMWGELLMKFTLHYPLIPSEL